MIQLHRIQGVQFIQVIRVAAVQISYVLFSQWRNQFGFSAAIQLQIAQGFMVDFFPLWR